jgi:hypothetical protein
MRSFEVRHLCVSVQTRIIVSPSLPFSWRASTCRPPQRGHGHEESKHADSTEAGEHHLLRRVVRLIAGSSNQVNTEVEVVVLRHPADGPQAPGAKATSTPPRPVGEPNKCTPQLPTIYNWRKQDLIDRGERPGLRSPELAELQAARRQIGELEAELAATTRANELLKVAVPTKGRFGAIAQMAEERTPDPGRLSDPRAVRAGSEVTWVVNRSAFLALAFLRSHRKREHRYCRVCERDRERALDPNGLVASALLPGVRARRGPSSSRPRPTASWPVTSSPWRPFG